MPRILIYGGTDLSTGRQAFVKALTRKLIENPSVILVSGGFEIFVDHPERVSTDVCVRDAARETLRSLPEERFKTRFETWLPAEDKDRRGVQRFKAGEVRIISGRSHQARRFTLVMGVDAIVTVSGEGNTRTVLELAYTVDKPALPLSFTGKDSKWFWNEYKDQVCDRFRLSPQLTDRLESRPGTKARRDTNHLAADVASAVISAAQKWRCLVLMPYGGEHDSFYEEHISPAIVSAGFQPHRIDRDDHAGRIFELFGAHLKDSRAVILDATGQNENVMYELGYANALGIQPLIVSRDSPRKVAELPFYLGENKMVFVRARGELLKERIQNFLRDLHPAARSSKPNPG